MSTLAKTVDTLTPGELSVHPVWQFTRRRADESFVRPVKRIPVASLVNRVVGTTVELANGQSVWALIGNVDTRNAELNEHFVTLSIESHGTWFHLARYHDHDVAGRGPARLARFLKLKIDDVFPIKYDISRYTKGSASALVGVALKSPRKRLTRAQIIGLAVPDP